MHILDEDNLRRELVKEELMTELLLQHWLFALIAAHSMCTTPFVGHVDTTEEKLLSKAKMQFKTWYEFYGIRDKTCFVSYFIFFFSTFQLAITK